MRQVENLPKNFRHYAQKMDTAPLGAVSNPWK